MDGFKRNNAEGLRDRCLNLMSHHTLARGDNARHVELADLHSVVLENEGFSRCLALVVVLLNGKTNQHGHLDMAWPGAFGTKTGEPARLVPCRSTFSISGSLMFSIQAILYRSFHRQISSLGGRVPAQ